MNARDKIINYAESNESELMYIVKLLVDRVDIYGANEVAELLLIESDEHVYQYVGNDTTVFDEVGDCTEMELPFDNITELANLIESADSLDVKLFKTLVNQDLALAQVQVSELYKFENVLIAYDESTQVHYFFV